MIGVRGVPAEYGGFETCAEQVGARLAALGHEVTVYCRSNHYPRRPPRHRGIRLRYLPAHRGKHSETLSHTALAAVAARNADAIVCFGVGNSPIVRAMQVAGRRVVFNIDGSDWKRPKWGSVAAAYLRVSEVLAAHSRSVLVADSRAVQAHFQERFNRDSEFIPYGAEPPADHGTETLLQFGLSPGAYILFVGRLEPENGAHDVVAASAEAGLGIPAVIVGDATYPGRYITDLHATAPAGTVFTGYQFGAAYQQLTAHAALFVLAAQVGGTHPVLVEQMAAGNCIVARDTASNREVLGDAGVWWDEPAELPGLLSDLIRDARRREQLGQAARQRQLDRYDWDRVTAQYQRLCQAVTTSALDIGA
ncbi:MAG: glycosyltransferase [Candidatus Dormibacteria bacterium]